MLFYQRTWAPFPASKSGSLQHLYLHPRGDATQLISAVTRINVHITLRHIHTFTHAYILKQIKLWDIEKLYSLKSYWIEEKWKSWYIIQLIQRSFFLQSSIWEKAIFKTEIESFSGSIWLPSQLSRTTRGKELTQTCRQLGCFHRTKELFSIS